MVIDWIILTFIWPKFILLCALDLTLCWWECLFFFFRCCCCCCYCWIIAGCVECGLLYEKTVFMLLCVKDWCRVRRRLHQTISTSKWSHVITTLQTQYLISHIIWLCHFLLWHFCNGQIDFVKICIPFPRYSLVVEQQYMLFLWTITLLCNVWML